VEALLAQSFPAVRHGTGGRAGGEDAVNAGRAHFVVAFWVYEELEGGVEVAVRFADRADVVEGVRVVLWAVAGHGLRGERRGCGVERER